MSTYEKQRAVTENAQEFNVDDQHEIETITTEMHTACTEYVRQAELFELNPNPIPHPHPPHEEKARFCKWASWFFTVIGVLVTIYLTAAAVDWPLIGAAAAAAVFLMLEFGVKLGIAAAVSEKVFVRRFHALYWPWLGVLLASIAILWLGRNASPELAEVLLKYSTIGWCSAEIALLFLGAYAFVGHRRFGWSGDAVARVRTLEARSAELTKRIDRRNGKFLATVVGAILAGTSAHAQCPLLLVDRTGSLATQAQSEAHLVTAVTANAHRFGCARVAPFSAHVLAAVASPIQWTTPGATTIDVFRSMAEARKTVLQEAARAKIEKVLSDEALPPAHCTSMPDVAARALWDTGPVLILTDGVHDCGPSATAPPSVPTPPTIIVVLAPSKNDGPNEYELFTKRARALQRLLPRAQIFAEGQVAEAVERWISPLQTVSTVKVSLR